MAITLGLACKLFAKAGGVGGTGTFTEITDVGDVKLNIEADEADVTTRANGGWQANEPTLKKATIEFDMMWDHSNTGYQMIRSAFFAGTVIGVKVMDGDATAGEGLIADMKVFKFDADQPLKDATKVSVSLKPSYSATAPTWQVGT